MYAGAGGPCLSSAGGRAVNPGSAGALRKDKFTNLFDRF